MLRFPLRPVSAFTSALLPTLLGLAFVFLAAESRAEGRTFSAVDPDSVLAQALQALPGRPLSLQEALSRAVETSPRIGQAKSAWASAVGVVRRERGAFDPELFAQVDVQGAETPSSSFFAADPVVEQRDLTSSFGARAHLPFGASLTASVDASKNETNNIYQSRLDPEYRAVGRLELRQPLLRGFGPGTRGPLSAAERRAEAEQLRYEQAERDARADTESLYWELYAAERDYVVQQLIVDQADALLEQARVRAEAGLIGPDQVANARVFVAQQRLGLLDQEEGLAATSDRLAELIGVPPGEASRYHTIEAPDFATDSSILGRSIGSGALLTRAAEASRELQAARLDLAALEATARSEKWNALPTLDVVGSLGGNGLRGVLRDDSLATGFSSRLDGGLRGAVGQSLARDYPTWAVGIELTLPIGLRAGRGERDRAGAEASRQRARIVEIERGIESDLRDAVRRYENGAARLELAREGVDAANEQVRIGLIEFENGRSTAFELVRLAADLASAQQELSRALVRTATARTDLYRLVGPWDESHSESVGGNR